MLAEMMEGVSTASHSRSTEQQHVLIAPLGDTLLHNVASGSSWAQQGSWMRAGPDGRMESEEREESVWQRNEVGNLATVFKCHNNAQFHRGAGGQKYLRGPRRGKESDFCEG